MALWVTKESWTRLATIPYWSNCLRPICASKNGEKVLMLETEVERVEMNLLCNVKLIVCNLKEYTYRRIFYDPKARIEETTYVIIQKEREEESTYVESLYSVDCNDGFDVGN